MKVLVINGSPRCGTVSRLLDLVGEGVSSGSTVQRLEIPSLTIAPCVGCLSCVTSDCSLPEDDGHRIAERIREADSLVVGLPTHMGAGMSGQLKLLFDRMVPVLTADRARKGKKAAIVTASTVRWPYNLFSPGSRGGIRAVRGVLAPFGYRMVGTVVLPGTRSSTDIPAWVAAKCRSLGASLG